MTLLQALFLGVLQGLTEFFPISSSGHLVAAETFLSLEIRPEDALGFTIILHTGTLLALLACYARQWWDLLSSLWSGDMQQRRMLLCITVATIPAAIIGVLLGDRAAHLFQSTTTVGFAFLVTAIVLLIGEMQRERYESMWYRFLHPFQTKKPHPSLRSALFIGLAQTCALVPGLSRSGLTISTGRMMGFARSEALDFSFLMAAPIIAGASVFAILEAVSGSIIFPETTVVLTGFMASFASSVFAILVLRRFVVRHSLSWFVPYLLLAGILLLVLL